jgi:hypothetical protein
VIDAEIGVFQQYLRSAVIRSMVFMRLLFPKGVTPT